MITAYRARDGRLVPADPADTSLHEMAWIDLTAPTTDEEKAVEAAFGIGIPTREDMQEIELSSRLYHENGALFLTAQVLATRDAHVTEIGPVTFVVLKDCLVTVHYHHPGSFTFFAGWAARREMGKLNGAGTLMGLLEAVVDRLADILEGEARKLDLLSKAIFEAHRPKGKAETLAALIQRIGRAEDLNGKVGESLATIRRILGFLSVPGGMAGNRETLAALDRAQLKTLAQDVGSLREVAETQATKIRFQLDATLGVINIRQSDIIKIFSVVAFVFLPPTLIASVYGMNFDVMPELHWPWGYPMALGLMFLSALIPWLIFRWKKLL